jgi:hypothetical protein
MAIQFWTRATLFTIFVVLQAIIVVTFHHRGEREDIRDGYTDLGYLRENLAPSPESRLFGNWRWAKSHIPEGPFIRTWEQFGTDGSL